MISDFDVCKDRTHKYDTFTETESVQVGVEAGIELRHSIVSLEGDKGAIQFVVK